MKKMICVILSAILLMLNINTCYSNPISIIDNIRKREIDKTSISNDLILKSINRENRNIKVEVITKKEKIDEIKPSKERLTGIDISKWNGDIDWKAVKESGIEFVIIRAGYGTGYVDPYFKQNIKAAIENDMLIGIYWFSYAYTPQLAKAEAEKCYKTIKPYKKHISLPVFWDFEYDSVNRAKKKGRSIDKSLASNMADTFCTTIKNKGFHTGIYCNIDYSRNYFTKDVLSKYHTWIAQWTNNCTYTSNYIIWQCSSTYSIKGKYFDLNYLYYEKYKKEISKCKNKPRKKMTVSATAYHCGTITSTGITPRWGIIAVDPKVIPYGSIVYIPTFDKYFVAEDCGGGIKGNKIDIYMNDETQCINWGVRKIKIEIVQ